MSDIAIRVENLGKMYRIGTQERRPDNLWQAARQLAASPFEYLRRITRPPTEEETLWALRDVSFEVKRGEVIGVIGRNGAGKSTLLKILSRITEPTHGHAEIHGRVGSLLEVGTGFHPELTGRENIYLNGAILGMKRTEIDRKFDEIVAFSEIEKFLDTPVKRYSSGMYVRLAFAVAAHLDPEILLVDEVLAVGDAGFQKKALGKMGEVTGEGRTVLFVSHNMTAIQSLCSRTVLLSNGSIHYVGSSRDAIASYLSSGTEFDDQSQPGLVTLDQRENEYGTGDLLIREIHLFNSRGDHTSTFLMGEKMQIVIDVCEMSKYREAQIGLIIKSSDGQWITSITSGMRCEYIDVRREKHERATLLIPRIPLTPNTYWIDVSIAQPGIGRLDYVERAARFVIEEADVYGTGTRVSSYFGVFYLDAYWKIESART